MAHEIIMPALGMAQETGRLVAWLKNEGDAVSKGDPLMEVETDKSTMEVEAPKDGFLVNITALANTDIPVGEVVAHIVDNLDDIPTKVMKKADLASEKTVIEEDETQKQATNHAMAHEIIMPALGMAQETGRLVAWLKNEGDSVSKGDPLMEVETDKSTMEVEAPKDGFLVNITALANTDIPVGEVVAHIVDNLDDIPTKVMKKADLALERTVIESDETQKQLTNKDNTDNKVRLPRSVKYPNSIITGEKILASPKLRSLAAAENLDLKNLRNAGYTEPFKAADIAILKQLSVRENISLRRNATSLLDKTSFDIFLTEINSASQNLISAGVVFASFISASLRITMNEVDIGINYKSGNELQSVIYNNPDKQQLGDVLPTDLEMPVLAEVNDLTFTDFIQLSGDTNSNIIFTISNFTDQLMITLDWDPNSLNQADALKLLLDVGKRIKSPLKQLL